MLGRLAVAVAMRDADETRAGGLGNFSPTVGEWLRGLVSLVRPTSQPYPRLLHDGTIGSEKDITCVHFSFTFIMVLALALKAELNG